MNIREPIFTPHAGDVWVNNSRSIRIVVTRIITGRLTEQDAVEVVLGGFAPMVRYAERQTLSLSREIRGTCRRVSAHLPSTLRRLMSTRNPLTDPRMGDRVKSQSGIVYYVIGNAFGPHRDIVWPDNETDARLTRVSHNEYRDLLRGGQVLHCEEQT